MRIPGGAESPRRLEAGLPGSLYVAYSWVGTPEALGAYSRKGQSGASSRPVRCGPRALNASCERGIGESADRTVGLTVLVATGPLWPGGESLQLEVGP